MKKQIGKKLVLNKSTVANLENRMMLGIKGGSEFSTLPETCPCIDDFTDSDPPTIKPCPTAECPNPDPTGGGTLEPGNTV